MANTFSTYEEFAEAVVEIAGKVVEYVNDDAEAARNAIVEHIERSYEYDVMDGAVMLDGVLLERNMLRTETCAGLIITALING